MKNIWLVLCALITFSGCEKIVHLDYNDNQSKIIIEGNITNEAGPYYVKLTKSIPISETGINPAVDGAVVTISDDAGNSETLTAEGNGVYSTQALLGTEGRTYTLTVKIADEVYVAQSTMPQRVPFDAVKIDTVTVMGDLEYNLVPVYTDPMEKGNNYRFVLSVNNALINQHFVQNDDLRNGEVNTSRLEVNDDDLKLAPGDVVEVTMECVDKNVALYYTTLALMTDSGPGGGTTPNNPPNNISNGALGLFSAHTVETKTVTIP